MYVFRRSIKREQRSVVKKVKQILKQLDTLFMIQKNNISIPPSFEGRIKSVAGNVTGVHSSLPDYTNCHIIYTIYVNVSSFNPI